jgi:hypothetical protein
MNAARVYAKAIGKDFVTIEPEDESAQLILTDEKARWLSNQFTVKLFANLRERYYEELESCLNCIENEQLVKAKLIRAKQLKELMTYGT